MKIRVKQKENNFKNEFEIFYNGELKYIAKVPSVSIDSPLQIEDLRKIRVNDLDDNIVYTTNYNYSLKKNNRYLPFKFLINGEQTFNQLLFVTKNRSIKVYYEENSELGNRYVIDVNSKQYYCYSVNDGYIRHFPIFYREKQVAEILKSNIAHNDEYVCYIEKDYKIIRDGVALLTLYLDRSEYNSAYISDKSNVELSDTTKNKYYDNDWVRVNFDNEFFDQVDEAVALLKEEEKKLKKEKKTKVKKAKVEKKTVKKTPKKETKKTAKKVEKKTSSTKRTRKKKEELVEEVNPIEVVQEEQTKEETTKKKRKLNIFPKLGKKKEKLSRVRVKKQVELKEPVKRKKILFPKLWLFTKTKKVGDITQEELSKKAIVEPLIERKRKRKSLFSKIKVTPKEETEKKEVVVNEWQPSEEEIAEALIERKRKRKELFSKKSAAKVEEIKQETDKSVKKKKKLFGFSKLKKTEKVEETEKQSKEDIIEELKEALESAEEIKTDVIPGEISSENEVSEEDNVEEPVEKPVKKKKKFSFPKLWIASIFIIIILLIASYFAYQYRLKLEKEREEAKKNEKLVSGDVQAKILSIDSASISKDDSKNKLVVEGKMKLSFNEEKHYDVTIWGYCLGDEGEKYIIYGPDNEDRTYHDGNHKYTLVNTVNNEPGDVIYKDGTSKKFDDIPWNNVRIKHCKIEKIISYSKLKDNITVKTTKFLRYEEDIKNK